MTSSVSLGTANGQNENATAPADLAAEIDRLATRLGEIRRTIGTVIFGQEATIEQSLTALLAGGHVDVSILGGMEVDEAGNLANWMVPGKMVKGMGGAMDLVAGARRVVVAMEHTTREGAPKILKKCTLPLTGVRVVDTIATEMAYIRVSKDGWVLEEVAPGLTAEDVQKRTEARLIVSPKLKLMEC